MWCLPYWIRPNSVFISKSLKISLYNFLRLSRNEQEVSFLLPKEIQALRYELYLMGTAYKNNDDYMEEIHITETYPRFYVAISNWISKPYFK